MQSTFAHLASTYIARGTAFGRRRLAACMAVTAGIGFGLWCSAADDQPVAPPVAEVPAILTVARATYPRSVEQSGSIQLCQGYGPAPSYAPAPTAGPAINPGLCNNGQCANGDCNNGCGNACNKPIYGIDCRNNPDCGEQGWKQWGPIPWQAFGQGEFIGPIRTAPVDEYRLRPQDQVEFIYRLTRVASARAYTFQVGDTLKIESIVDTNLNREVMVQPDGTITALHIGRVKAARRTADELKDDLEARYLKDGGYRIIDLTVSPQKTNTKLEDLRAAVDSRFFTGGQGKLVTISPDGRLRLPAIGPVCALGLTLEELKVEVDARYAAIVEGMEISPILQTRAPRFVYVLGEVKTAGRFTLEAPTTVMQALALAGGSSPGGNLREVVVFRRGEDWRLLATKLDIRGATLGKRPSPADEIWLRDSDLVVVPKSSIQRTDEFIDQVFTKGIYGVLPATIIGSAVNAQGNASNNVINAAGT